MSRLERGGSGGFTVLEVLIAVALLSVISLSIYQATTETYRLRDILLHEGDFYNGIRLSMGIMERDVSLVYSPTLLLPDAKPSPDPGSQTNPFASPASAPATDAEPQNLQAALPADLLQTTQFWLPAVNKNGVRPSRFVGTENKMSFVSASHIRAYKDAQESDFAKITYELADERVEGAPEGKVLVKTESTNAFSDDDRGDKLRKSYPLLHGITKFRFRYYRKDKDQWVTTWDTDKSEFKNLYPNMVEVTLEVKGPQRLVFEGIYKFRPEIPLHGLDPSI